MEQYKVLSSTLGEGAHGIVLKARHIQSGNIVALKKVPLKRIEDGLPNSVFREIKTLQHLRHPNIVTLLEIIPDSYSVILSFEYMESNLAEVLQISQTRLSESHIKMFMIMLLRGIHHCHSHKIIHRDVKPANLLISQDGILKIADFGLARLMLDDDEIQRQYSHQVATRWYRAPELLYGARQYDFGVDMWSVGCIFAEMLNHTPLFPGMHDIDQLSLVLSTLGTPDEIEWPQLESLPDYNKINFPPSKGLSMEELIPDTTNLAQGLLSSCLKYDSTKRIAAEEALSNPYFFTQPLPATPSTFWDSLKRKPDIDYDIDQPLQLKSLNYSRVR
ncbi:kinase-like domain-containing protein [Paraphysoderma sedebokerense]|nr:kinase-like domain-containing protein [Paraphysoderma sedebokerense]